MEIAASGLGRPQDLPNLSEGQSMYVFDMCDALAVTLLVPLQAGHRLWQIPQATWQPPWRCI